MAVVDERGDLGAGVGAGSDAELFRTGDEFAEELLVAGAGDEQPGAGDAALSAGGEDAVHDAGEGLLQVGVLQHDRRGLAAEFEGDGDEFVGGGVGEGAAGGGAAGEGDLLHGRVADDRVADDAAAAGQDGEQGGGQPGLGECPVDEAAEREGDEGRPLGGLEEDGVARGEGGGELLGVAGDRRVPGGDRADDADGFVDAHRDVRAAGGREGVLGGLQGGGGVAEGAAALWTRARVSARHLPVSAV